MRPGDRLTMVYADAMPPGERTSTVLVARQGILQARPSDVATIGDTIQITVLDADLSLLPVPAAFAFVTATAALSSTAQVVVPLVEAGAGSGIFTGQLTTCMACNDAATLLVQPGAALKLTYADPYEPPLASMVKSSLVIASVGTISLAPLTVQVGGVLTLLLTDRDVRFLSDGLNVTVHTIPSPDAEYDRIRLPALQLRGVVAGVQDALNFFLDAAATNVDGTYVGGLLDILGQTCSVVGYSGTSRLVSVNCPSPNLVQIGTPYFLHQWGQFGGLLQTVPRGISDTAAAAAASASGALAVVHVDVGVEVEAVYEDDSPRTAVRCVAMVSNSSGIGGYFAVEAGGPALWSELRDTNLDHNLASPSQLIASVTNQRTGEVEPLVLVETGADVGVLRGWVRLLRASDAGPNGDGALCGLPGDPLALAYSEPLPPGLRQAALALAFAAAVDLPAPDFALGEPLVAVVNDADLDADPAVPDAVAGLTSFAVAGGDFEPVALVETGPSSGRFTAALPTRRLGYQPGCTLPNPSQCPREVPAPANGVLEADFGAVATFTYGERAPAGLRARSSVAVGRPSVAGAVTGAKLAFGGSLAAFREANRPALRATVFVPALAADAAASVPSALRVTSSLAAAGPDGRPAALVGGGMLETPPGQTGWSNGTGAGPEAALALSNAASSVYQVRSRRGASVRRAGRGRARRRPPPPPASFASRPTRA